MKRGSHLCIGCLLLLMTLCSIASAFDVAVYFDARSGVDYRSCNPTHSFCGWVDRQTVLSRIQSEQQVFTWFDEMGVTHLIVHYPFDDDFYDLNARDLGNVKVLNASYPAEAFKYLDAQNRTVFTGCADSNYVNDDGSSWGDSATGRTAQLNGTDMRVLEMQCISADTMWLPSSDLGIWNGWDRREAGISGDIYMPMHFRISCNLARENNPPANDTIATFFWLVADPADSDTNGIPDYWWRYPGQVLTVGDFDSAESHLDTFEFTIDPSPEDSNVFQQLNENFEPIANTDSSHRFSALWGLPVRMSIYYHGNNQVFQVYEVDAWDEGYHRLLVDPASQDTMDEFIASAFRRQLSLSPGKMIGWYYDESQQKESINPWIRINDILQEAGLPTMYLNGHYGFENGPDAENSWRNIYYRKADSAGVSIPTCMDEYYFLKDGSGCQPYNWGGIAPELLPVDTSSDAAYFEADSCGFLPHPWRNQTRYEGHKSLQAAIDGSIFGWKQFFVSYLDTLGPNNMFATEQMGMINQVRYNHSHGSQYWAMVQGYDDGGPIQGCCPIRIPEPNEIKLQAWLSVAADCDGMIWYPVQMAGGLLEWNPPLADNCPYGGLSSGPCLVEPTDRYFAAKETCNDIQRIAPLLEPLDFVRTYASRAFETSYGESDCTWVALDNLADANGHQSYIRYINTCWPSGSVSDQDDDTYVQISRFKTPGLAADAEDYWFLVVNRRALEHWDERNVHITVGNVGYPGVTYLTEQVLAGKVVSTITQGEPDRTFIIHNLKPGEAELVHFFRADTSDLVITTDTTIYAPVYFHRNVVVQNGGHLTILPNMSALRDSIVTNDSTIYRWDSVATVTFWQGKGLRYAPGDDSTCGLHIFGNDTTAIRFQSANADQPWSGIQITENALDDIVFEYMEVVGAQIGLAIEGGPDNYGYWTTPWLDIEDCSFHDCKTGVTITSQASVRVTDTQVFDNETGIWCGNAWLQMEDCDVHDNTLNGVFLAPNALGRFTNVDFTKNGSGYAIIPDSMALMQSGALSVLSATAELKCCSLYANPRGNISAWYSTITMTDAGSSNPMWGWNYVDTDSANVPAIKLLHSIINLDQGHNSITGPLTPDSAKWIYSTTLDGCSRNFRNNYWGITNTNQISAHLPASVVLIPALSSWNGCSGVSQDSTDDDVEAILIDAKRNAADEDYSTAAQLYEGVIEQYHTCMFSEAAIREHILIDIRSETSEMSVDYFQDLADTTTVPGTELQARLAEAWSRAFSGNVDSAISVVSTLEANAASDSERVYASVELLMLDLLKQNTDTADFVTADELISVMDSVRCLLASLQVWTQTDIYDTVVMYAPCTVKETVMIHPNGRLEIRPLPGVRNAEIRVENGAYFNPWWNGYGQRGHLVVQGMSSCPVVLNSIELGWSLVYAAGGKVELLHTKMIGEGICADLENTTGFGSVLKVDSCEFALFDDGLWLLGTDTSSYIRNSRLHHMGSEDWWGAGWGASISCIESNHIRIENCTIDNGNGIGVLGVYGGNADIVGTLIDNSAGYGIMLMDGSSFTIDCSELTANGDSLPEVWVTDGLVDLVGAHTLISDTTGTLIYAADPSYVDLGDGENGLELQSGSGFYIESGDTTATWDITLNNWYPANPADSTFYDHLYPHTPTKWLVDTSLASFLACGEGSSMSMGGGSFIVQGDNEGHSDSYEPPAGDLNLTAIRDNVSTDLSKAPRLGSSKLNDELSKSNKPTVRKQTNRAEMLQRHHREQEQWRAIKEMPTADKMAVADAVIAFVNENPSSPLIPAALTRAASLAGKETAGLATFLSDQAKAQPNAKTRTLARRLSFLATAKEGQPGQALRGLEEMIETATTPRDSIKALVSAMGVYFLNRNDKQVQPRNPAVICTDRREFVQRTIALGRMLSDPTLGASRHSPAIPTEYRLYQNFPNPFNPITEIRFDLPEAVRVELRIFNVLGQEVAKLVDDVRPAGAYNIQWDSRNVSGASVASGMYVYQLKAGKFTDARKMILLR